MLEVSEVGFAYGRWRRQEVFASLDWSVAPGQRTLLLGPNGAGKSTLLKLLCGYVAPHRGEVRWDGSNSRRLLSERVGWMPQSISPVKGLTVSEQLEYAAWVSGRSRRDSRSLVKETLAAVRLDDKSTERATSLSGGQLRRLGLAQALVRQGDVLLLDEPTAGLDPAQTSNFRDLLRGVEAPGGVVVSTHQVSDLADDVDRVAVLAGGVIHFDGTVDEFRSFGVGLGVDSGDFSDIFSNIVRGGLH